MPKIFIFFIVLIVIATGNYLIRQSVSEDLTSEEAKTCEVDEDCLVFGENGDCNCGCFNKNYQWQKQGDCFCATPISCKCVNGKCQDVFEEEISNFQECVAAGYAVMESYPRQCRTEDGKTFTEDIGNELEKIDLIRINNPRPNQVIQSPLTVEGEARGFWFFEADFPVKLYDTEGNLITVAMSYAQSDWMTEDFVPFRAELYFEIPASEKGTLILEKDNPSGLSEHADELRIPVKFDLATETMKVKIYFNNNNLDPEVSCNKVFPVERTVLKTQAVAKTALTELLKGTIYSEAAEGYFTNINPGVKIQSLVIENGVVKVDFDEQLEFQVGGSCKVGAIRAQITETLKQFSTVDEVVISINGRTEDILQP